MPSQRRPPGKKLSLYVAILFFLSAGDARGGGPQEAGEEKPILVVFDVELNGPAAKALNKNVVSDAITEEFTKSEEFSVVDRDTLYYHFKQMGKKREGGCPPDEPECLADLAAEMDAKWFVKSEVSDSGGRCNITVKLYKRGIGTAYFVEKTKSAKSACGMDEIEKASHSLAVQIRGGELPASGSGGDEKAEGKPEGPEAVQPSVAAAPPAERGSGVLVVSTKPEGCRIFIDSEDHGVSPKTIENLGPGERTVVLAKEGYSTVTETVKIVNGRRAALKKTLAAETGGIEITGPAGTKVAMDGKPRGAISAEGKPLKIEEVPATKHALRFENPDFEAAEIEVEVRNKAVERVAAGMKGKPAKLLITSTPLKAKVTIAGEERGETPYAEPLPPGRYNVRLALAGYKSVKKEIELGSNKPFTMNVVMEAVAKGQEEGPMVLIPGGFFFMGCNEKNDKDCADNEKPGHLVKLDAFYMDKHEVTNDEFLRCVKEGACSHHFDDETCSIWDGTQWAEGKLPRSFRDSAKPVVCVSWGQAKKYCEWAGKRLPTEAEWEKAARGADGRKYPWGNDPEPSCERAVIMEPGDAGAECGGESSMPVGSKPKGASPFGIEDMIGGVSEFTADWFGAEYYESAPDVNPRGPESGDNDNRVSRGGAWSDNDVTTLRASCRFEFGPDTSDNATGFRCAAPAP